MKKLAEKHNGWSKELHYRATWSSEGITSRAALLQKIQRHRNFCVGKHYFLLELIEKSAARNETTLLFPPLELALLRLGQPFSLFTASLAVYLKQHYQIINRPLKNGFEAADARQKQARKRSLCVINEHFEPVFNTVAATQMVFQRPAKQVMPLELAVRTMKRVENEKLAAYPENSIWEYKILSASSVSNATQAVKPNTITTMAVHHLPRVEISPAQYFRRSSQVGETSQSFAAPGNNYPFIRTAASPNITSATVDTQIIETKVSSLVDTLYDHAIQSHAIPDFNLRMLSSDSQENALPIAANTQLTQHSEKTQIKSSVPVQLNRSDITRVADQVAKVLNHRMGLERERKGGFY